MSDPNARSSDLRWPSSLGFRLALLLLVLLGGLGAGVWYASRYLMNDRIEADIRSFEQSGARSLAARLGALGQRFEGTASMLAQLAMQSGGGSQLRPTPANLIEAQALIEDVVAVGIWPEPNSVDSARDRASLYWVKGASGKLEAHGDYNDPRAVPYYREAWYTPARYVAADRCYWTPAYLEPLARQQIVSCSMPMHQGNRFLGVVTLSVSLQRLGTLLDAALGEEATSYGMLVDSSGQILAASKAAVTVIDHGGRPANLAELAQRAPGFNPLAIALHQYSEDQRRAATGKPGVQGADIIALKTATRDFSSGDADRVLTQIRETGGGGDEEPLHVDLPADAVFSNAASATLIPLRASGWSLIQVLPEGTGLAGARQLFVQTMALAGILAVALLFLVLVLTRLAVLDPLRRMVRKLASAGASDDPLKLVLDESPRNELGAMAFWINERGRQLREHLDRASAGQLQLSIEAKERRTLTDQLVRFHERTLPALHAVSDALVTVDENNAVEDVNPAAEQLLGVSAAAVRGRPLSEVVNGRSTTSDVTAASAALSVMQRGTRLDLRENFSLANGAGGLRELRLSVMPVRTRGNRINETAGRAAGDEAIGKLAEALVTRIGSAGEVFHLHADRFAAVLPGYDINRAATTAKVLCDGVANLRIGSGSKSLGFTVSIGVEEFGNEANPADALQRAEDACIEAKRAGRNQVKAFDSSMARAEREVDDVSWVRRVRAGFEQNMLHLTTQFIATASGGGAHFESLLTLEDEEGFWSPAAAFMPAAERHGLAASVDRWHITNVCSQLLRGDTLKRVASVSIQISQSSLLDNELPDFLIALIEKYKALAGRFSLLLSESSVLSYPNQALKLAGVLRAVGIPCAISDFLGRDPAALATLRQLPADTVRVDARRFGKLSSDPVEQKLADGVLQLARGLQKKTWVFGIDDATQLETWRRLNADLYQGGAIAKASPVVFQAPARPSSEKA